uniref:Uroporphyrinogen-III synthase n=1 Tax=Pseudo-nitzschia australis TaxID=44445 RepID=A0A7S4ATH7_9STRA|mmetsp:Transcript_24953/g.54717  ORF Transcript_24953/g.54717 Transcript_24953/m.54717 type:complete len:317 (+) Transcript_24953:106-1056(+)
MTMDNSKGSTFVSLSPMVITVLIFVIGSSLSDIGVAAFVPYNSFLSSKPIRAATAIAAAEHTPIVITLTREDGKNEKLIKKMEENSQLMEEIDVLEMPCIEHAVGPDYEQLSSTLLSERWDFVAITSPEAANILASAWDAVRDNPLPVVAVGKATENRLKDSEISVAFVPSKATAKTLAKELESVHETKKTSVLYPASAKAKKTLENDLMARGFAVKRLNTYDTVTATWTDEQKESSNRVLVACFASPSAVKGWLKNTGGNTGVLAACIGETSASACEELGWEENQIFFPESPGLEGWVEAIQKATEFAKKSSYSL